MYHYTSAPFTEAAKLEEQNCPFAMAQIVDSRGST
ncbi:hypothetical protein, partial [Escherichia coli]